MVINDRRAAAREFVNGPAFGAIAESEAHTARIPGEHFVVLRVGWSTASKLARSLELVDVELRRAASAWKADPHLMSGGFVAELASRPDPVAESSGCLRLIEMNADVHAWWVFLAEGVVSEVISWSPRTTLAYVASCFGFR